MATILYDQPERYGLAYNDNPYVIRSTDYTPTQRWKVSIIDPALNNIATMLVYPRQGVTSNGVVTENRTYVDPSRILQSQIGSCIAIPSANHASYVDCSSMGVDYAMTFLEQDKVNGVYVDGDLLITDIKTVWNGGVEKLDWLDFDYTDFQMENGAITNKRFLTNAPSTQYINDNQSAFLYFLNPNQEVIKLNLVSYDSGGGLVQIGSIDITPSTDFSYVPVGTYDIQNSDSSNWTIGSPATFLNSAAYYTVAVATNASSEVFTFRINERCSKYEPIRLHWLNRLGGYDSFNFSLKSMESTDIDRSSYLSQEHNFTGTRWEYTKASRGTTDYHVGTKKKLTVNTPYLNEAESIWMEDFATSPIVYQESGNELIAMSGKPKLINKQTSLNDKLMQYEFELEYSLTDMRQRG